MDERGQISAELLIILAAMAALALFLVDQLQSTATEMNKTYSSKITELNKKINEIGG